MSGTPDLDLFGSGPKLKKPRTKTIVEPGSVQRLILQYVAGFHAQFGEKPVVYKSDGALLKSLIAQFGESMVSTRLGAFLRWDDQYIRATGYALHVFHRQWNRLTATVKPSAPASSRVPDAARTDEYRRSLRR